MYSCTWCSCGRRAATSAACAPSGASVNGPGSTGVDDAFVPVSLPSLQVDSWLDFASNELEVPVTSWLYPVLGYLPFNAAVHAESVAQVS